jgi:hypothetical protein
MFKRVSRLPSPAAVISMIALLLVLGGTAVAATRSDPDTTADTKLIKKIAPTLSVKHAKDADKLGGKAASAYAAAAPLSFTNATLANGWGAAATYGTARYAKDQFGIVHLAGAVSNSSSSSAVIFTLPAGYRAAPNTFIDEPVEVYGGTAPGEIEIAPDGDVHSVSATKFVDLDGVNFVPGG